LLRELKTEQNTTKLRCTSASHDLELLSFIQTENYRVKTDHLASNFELNKKYDHRISVKNKLCNSGISLFNSGIAHHSICNPSNHQIDLPLDSITESVKL